MTITKPILILPPGAISKEDLAKLNENGICSVEAEDPSKIKFLDPIPSAGDRGKIENACILLSRRLLNWNSNFNITKADVSNFYIQALMDGTCLSDKPTQEEKEAALFRNEKSAEIARLAREEAKAERAAEKAKKSKPIKPQRAKKA